MPNFKPVVRKDFTSENGKCRVYIQFSFKGKSRILKTDYYVEPQFMQKSGRIKDTYPLANSINFSLSQEVSRCIKVFSERRYTTINDLLTALKRDETISADLLKYGDGVINDLTKEGKHSSARTYTCVVLSLREMVRGELPFADIDSAFVEKYKDHLLKSGRSINTSREYLSKLNTLVNKAVDQKLVDGKLLPERGVVIKAEKKPIRLLSVEDIQKLYRETHSRPNQESVDCWFLSFFMCGLNPRDLWTATRKDVHNDRIVINRAKTGEPLSLKIPPEVMTIIDRHRGKKYLLSFLDRADDFKTIELLCNKTNVRLKRVAKKLGLGVNLTLAYARGSFATIASSKELSVPLEVIDAAQGRKIKGVTSRYVKYDLYRIDDAQEKVIRLITG